MNGNRFVVVFAVGDAVFDTVGVTAGTVRMFLVATLAKILEFPFVDFCRLIRFSHIYNNHIIYMSF